MKGKTILSVALLAFLFLSAGVLAYSELGGKSAPVEAALVAAEPAAPVATPAATDAVPQARVVAHYFHADSRCATCVKIEEYSREAIEGQFTTELADGRLSFEVINVQTPGNEHYISEYQLQYQSLVVSIFDGENEVSWTNLKDVWTLVSSKDRFAEYVRSNVRQHLLQAAEL